MASPLPSTCPNSGTSSASWWTSAPRARGDLGRAVLRGRVHHQDLVDQGPRPVERLHDRPDRVGHLARRQHHRDRLALALEQAARVGNSEWWKERIKARVLSQAVSRVQPPTRGRPCSKPGRDERARRDGPRARARPASPTPMPGRPAPGAARGLGGGRNRAALVASGRRARGRPARARDRHDRHRERQVAGVQPAGARHAGQRPGGAGALPLPHQGARPGPGAQARRARRPLPAPRDLRRRHAARGAARDPPALQPDPHQPRHAARGRAAQPPLLGRRAGQPGLGRGGRGARLPRRVRLARGQRAAPAAAAGPRLRQRAALRAHERHDRQPDASWPSGSPAWSSSWSTATARRAPSARSRCGIRRWSTRSWARGPPRWARPRSCSPTSSSARCARSAF